MNSDGNGRQKFSLQVKKWLQIIVLCSALLIAVSFLMILVPIGFVSLIAGAVIFFAVAIIIMMHR